MRVPARWPRSARSDIRGIAGEARVRQCEGAHGRCGCRPVARVGRMGAVPRTKESECSSGATTRSSRSARSTSTGPGKTVTEYDDHLFCLLTMNHHPLHLDANYAENTTQFGKNVVVGNYIYSLLLGHVRARRLRQGDRQPRDRVAAPRRADLPRRHDLRRDRRCSTSGSRRRKDDRGVVHVETIGYNQDGTVVCIFRRKVMVPKQTYLDARGGEQPGRPTPEPDKNWPGGRAASTS